VGPDRGPDDTRVRELFPVVRRRRGEGIGELLPARLRQAAALRDGPSEAADLVTFVNADASVCAEASPTRAYRKVVLSDGRTGYVADVVLELGKSLPPPPSRRDSPSVKPAAPEPADPRSI
jgi:hypothetical protein